LNGSSRVVSDLWAPGNVEQVKNRSWHGIHESFLRGEKWIRFSAGVEGLVSLQLRFLRWGQDQIHSLTLTSLPCSLADDRVRGFPFFSVTRISSRTCRQRLWRCWINPSRRCC
jgi:hypothetical protein